MSDPVTNVEIEDVLSSIRRLVSTDGRALKTEESPAEKAKPAEPERLVLTPSLRVDDAADRQKDERPDVEAQEASSDSADSWSADASHERVEFRHASSDDDWSDEVDAPEFEADEMRFVPSDEFDVDRATAEVEADSVPEEEEEPASRADPLRQRVAELEEVVARQPDQWEPDGPGGDGNSGSPVSPLPWEDYLAEDDEAGDAEDNEEAGFGETGLDEAEEVVEEAIAEAARAREAERERIRERTAAPASDEADEHDDTDIPQNFAAEDTGRSRRTDMDDLPENDFLPGNDEFLDEDALRDLVADIVRQELQGTLGERITRNVRKLVRREIHRALTSQDFQ